jgi:hypothetical protein
MKRNLRSCVEHTNFDLSHHIAFWEAVESLLPPGSLDDDGGLGSIWASATPVKQPELANIQSWLTFLAGPGVEEQSQGKIKPLTAEEACGFIGCMIVETGSPLLNQLDVVETGSGSGRGAMQYTGVRRTAYDKARAAAIAKKIDPNSNAWQQQYFAEEYAGKHDPSQGSLIGWTRIFEQRSAGMDPAKAAAYWTGSAATKTGYFRPGVPHLERRQAEAQRIWGLVQSKRLSVPQKPPAAPQKPPAMQQQPFPNPLQVPWYSQLDSADREQARRMCFSSSSAMLLQHLKPGTLFGPNGDDQYLRRVLQYGDTTNPNAQISALKSYGIRARFTKTCSMQELEQQINRGIPVPCGYLNRGSVTAPSGGGHWLIVVGYTSANLIVHDPFGEADLVAGTTISDVARFMKYSRKNFSPRWTVEGPKTGWAIIAER